MQGRAIARNIGMSARKMRLVIDQIRHQDVNAAYSILQFSKKAAAEPIDKALRSAVANAVYKADESGEALDVDDLSSPLDCNVLGQNVSFMKVKDAYCNPKLIKFEKIFIDAAGRVMPANGPPLPEVLELF